MTTFSRHRRWYRCSSNSHDSATLVTMRAVGKLNRRHRGRTTRANAKATTTIPKGLAAQAP
jgi:hypothetical protein